uniref:Uncharacterized protein n=1 Tax=Triticum urartu TaxID=4572 RepID=A0A8R7PKU4_TRIUA
MVASFRTTQTPSSMVEMIKMEEDISMWLFVSLVLKCYQAAGFSGGASCRPTDTTRHHNDLKLRW